jgi:peptide/nickel transport system ATP-binding protein
MSDSGVLADGRERAPEDDPLLEVRNLTKHYPITKGVLKREVGRTRAVDGITFEVARGETFGLVGESGCGKSTAATSLLRLEEPTAGEVVFDGENILEYGGQRLRAFRRRAQMIFQDPTSSFDPRMSIGESVAEPLVIHGVSDDERRRRIVKDLLERVGLSAADIDRYPHEFSGGQKQRVALARAMVVNPNLIVADEPTSALDVSIQSDILRLLNELQEDFGLSIVFISHDMGVIREVCDRVAVMYLGEIVEVGPTEELFESPQHPYTKALLASIPRPDPRQRGAETQLKGDVPDPANPPSGCRFHTRCPAVIQPEDMDVEQEHYQSIMGFRDQLRRGGVDVEAAREFAAAEYDVAESEVSDDDLDRALRDEFDLPESLDDPSVDEALSTALDRIVDEEFEAALERLIEAFESVCERRDPTHLRQEGYAITGEEWEAILSLHGVTASRDLDLAELRTSADGSSREALRAAVRSTVGLDGGLSDPDAETVVSEAIDAAVEGRQDQASTILYDAFADFHSSACHLNDDTVGATTGAMMTAGQND